MLGILYVVLLASGVVYAQCEPPAAVRPILDEALRNEQGLSQTERTARRIKILREGLERYPHDYSLLRRLIHSYEDREAKIRVARAALEQHSDQPVYQLIYADSLIGHDTPEAIRRMAALTKSHPELARAHYYLAYLTGQEKFKDPARSKSAMDAFLAACPAPLDDTVIGIVSRMATKEQVAKMASGVRKRLEAESDPLLISLWPLLWNAEFKARLPNEHPAIRTQIVQDLARLGRSSEAQKLPWLEARREGYQIAGDPAAVEKLSVEIVKRHPTSSRARSIIEERWRKEHPYPRTAGQAQVEAWLRAALLTYEEWRKRWPEDSLLHNQVFSALVLLPDTPAERIVQAGEALLASYRKNPNWYGMPPVEFRVASEYVKRTVNLDKVPALVEEGYRLYLKRIEDQGRDDRTPKGIVDSTNESAMTIEIERARVLLDYYEAVKQPEQARQIEADLSGHQPSRAYTKSSLLEVQAHAAELLGRKLDALMTYRAALASREPGQVPAGARNALADHVERLWKELGGTPAARALLTDEKLVQEAKESRWERPKNPLPAFELSDFEGKIWKLAGLQGKAVLVNVWAAWCGPCRAEHPEFQKLYEKLKARPEITVLTFNVDDETGKVMPYMAENKYTFPVLAAREFVNGYLPMLAIPQNWFIDPQGKLQWIQTGYGGEPNWQEMMLSKLEELAKGQKQ